MVKKADAAGQERHYEGVEDNPYRKPLSRRRFLTSMGALAVVGGFSFLSRSGFADPSKTKPKVVVGGHLWVYAAPQPGYDPTPVLETVFSDFSYAGIERIELMDSVLRHPESVDRVGELSHKYSVPVLGTSYEGAMWDRTKHTEILDDAGKVIERLSRLGGRTMGTSVGHAPKPKTPEQFDAQAELLRKITALGKSHGVALNLHNHTYEVENNEHDLKGTLARIPDAKLGPDLNWLVRGGDDPVDFLRRYSSRIVFLHLRDQNADGKWSEALGEGSMNYVAIARELHSINFHGDAVIELAHEKDFHLTRPLRESWKMSREFVRKTLGY